MSKKLKIMSLAVEPETHALLKQSAKKAGFSVSDLVRKLVDKHLSLIVNDGEEIPIILKVPAYLKENEPELRSWLDTKVEAITHALCPPKVENNQTESPF